MMGPDGETEVKIPQSLHMLRLAECQAGWQTCNLNRPTLVSGIRIDRGMSISCYIVNSSKSISCNSIQPVFVHILLKE